MTKVKFSSLADCEDWIEERVGFWFDWLAERVHDPNGCIDRNSFDVGLTYRGAKRAGSYNSKIKRINFNVAYAMLYGDIYDETICHEVCHAVQYCLMKRSAPHGDFFHWLYNEVCGIARGRCHSYNVRQAKLLGEYLVKLKKVEALRT